MKKAIIVGTNLLVGNYILWNFETSSRHQDHLDWRLALGFSVAALVLLAVGFRFIKPRQSLVRSVLLAAGVSFLVPVVGLMLSFLNFESLNGSLVGVFMAVVGGPMFWPWVLPMFVLNSIFFHWLSKKR